MVTDKRILKTRNGIKSALMQLLLNKEIGKITISDLAEKAQINRSTFYLHYQNINAVMKDIESEIDKDISDCINSFDVKRVYESIYTALTSLTELLNEKPDIKNCILSSTASDYLIGRLKDILIARTIDAVKQTADISELEIVYPLTFTAGGIIDTYVKWVHSDKSISLEELIKDVSEFTKFILEYIKVV